MSGYNPTRSYDWNYDHAPDPERDIPVVNIAPVPGEWRFLGLPVSSPLGVPAGPLLNGRWVLWYSRLGFDVLTYKTVRSRERACYPLPNLQPVAAGPLSGREGEVQAAAEVAGSWAVSFGMPSRAPEVWRRDVEWTRTQLSPGKVLSVSVVGTMQPGWGLEELAADYARCAGWAIESGAHCVEANLSCPNVSTADGQLYQQPEAAAQVARAVREAAGRTPVLLKIGHIACASEADPLVRAVAPYVNGLSMVNCLATHVRDAEGELLFDGELRGIAGPAIRDAAAAEVVLFRDVFQRLGLNLELVGVGGISSAADVRRFLAVGAGSVQLATAAMRDPEVAIAIRRELAAA